MIISEKKEEKERSEEKKEDNVVKTIILRSKKDLIDHLKAKSEKHKMSLNAYVNFILNSAAEKTEPIYKEVINKPEKKEIASRSYFTQSEMEVLKEHAKMNEWSISKEVRYRTIASIALTPKLNKEELRTMYSIRSSINVLGANINLLVRNSVSITDDNIKICQDLIELISELKNKISYLEKCNHSSFKVKEVRGRNGN